MSETKLKPCPFCGGEAKALRNIHNYYIVKCSKCSISTLQRGKKAEAINAWNTRKPIDRILERLEEKYLEAKKNFVEESLLEGGRYLAQGSAYQTAINIVKGETE